MGSTRQTKRGRSLGLLTLFNLLEREDLGGAESTGAQSSRRGTQQQPAQTVPPRHARHMWHRHSRTDTYSCSLVNMSDAAWSMYIFFFFVA